MEQNIYEENFYTVQEVAAILRFSERTVIRIIDRSNDPGIIRECAPGTSRVYRRIAQSALHRIIKGMSSQPPIKKKTNEAKKKPLQPIRLGFGRKQLRTLPARCLL